LYRHHCEEVALMHGTYSLIGRDQLHNFARQSCFPVRIPETPEKGRNPHFRPWSFEKIIAFSKMHAASRYRERKA
jgi:hypothetical protein